MSKSRVPAFSKADKAAKSGARIYDAAFSNLDYSGGPVMPSNTNYTVVWQPSNYGSHTAFQTGYVSGEAFLARADVLRACCGFDERYVSYFEDTDLSVRARRAGWDLEVIPRAVFRHAVVDPDEVRGHDDGGHQKHPVEAEGGSDRAAEQGPH